MFGSFKPVATQPSSGFETQIVNLVNRLVDTLSSYEDRLGAPDLLRYIDPNGSTGGRQFEVTLLVMPILYAFMVPGLLEVIFLYPNYFSKGFWTTFRDYCGNCMRWYIIPVLWWAFQILLHIL